MNPARPRTLHQATAESVMRCLLSQRADGSWRGGPAPLDVLETALTVRAFREDPAFREHALPAALTYLGATQHDDGGWAETAGSPRTEPGVTGLVLSSLAGLPVPHRLLEGGFAFLQEHQGADGLWCERARAPRGPGAEAVAHVLAALRAHPSAHLIPVEGALTWLGARVHQAGDGADAGPRLPGLPCAVLRTADALGAHSPHSWEAARALAGARRPDGGWSHTGDGPGTPGATGLALAALARTGLLHQGSWETAVALLLGHRADGGPGVREPGPLPYHSPVVTDAFVMTGLNALRHVAPTPETVAVA
ncbi:prenyltransferase/squalene oxidase repeat-containing protein [Streptomyces sp. NPDC001941]|uniref:prenyltransferase/squalene oxidase repeat-containing protein n=1 Tax=Streptomyces sp. NPDC001941 TaxID=3154659 RepID=UPI003327F1A2